MPAGGMPGLCFYTKVVLLLPGSCLQNSSQETCDRAADLAKQVGLLWLKMSPLCCWLSKAAALLCMHMNPLQTTQTTGHNAAILSTVRRLEHTI